MSPLCEECFLAQLEEFVSLEEIFTEYAQFFSYTNTWQQHARDYTDLMVERFVLDQQSRVVEVASNDGYLLQYFAKKHIPVLGIQPAVNVARAAIEKGIPTRTEFFRSAFAHHLVWESGQQYDSKSHCIARFRRIIKTLGSIVSTAIYKDVQRFRVPDAQRTWPSPGY